MHVFTREFIHLKLARVEMGFCFAAIAPVKLSKVSLNYQILYKVRVEIVCPFSKIKAGGEKCLSSVNTIVGTSIYFCKYEALWVELCIRISFKELK
jgi:hypothetical protein